LQGMLVHHVAMPRLHAASMTDSERQYECMSFANGTPY